MISNANASSDAAPTSLSPGAAFLGRYQVVRAIKAGGMGALYEVVHLETRRRRALKVMLPAVVADADMRARFRLEATITADIDSDHIVETFDAGIDPESGAPFLVMELLRGEDVAGALERRGRLPEAEVVTLLQQLAVALDKTHAAAIVHRDLKPENLFLTRRDDGSPRLKVLDFGIAKIVAQGTAAQATRSLGTPLYMAPEQLGAEGRLGPRADLYAVGHIAYTMLVGQSYWQDDPAFEGGVWPLLVKVMAGASEAPSARAARRGVALSPSFDAWFAKATARTPEERFDSASAMVSALGVALPTPPVGTTGASVPPPRESLAPGAWVAARTAPSALAGTLDDGHAEALTVVRPSVAPAPFHGGATLAPTINLAPAAPRRAAVPWTVGIAGVLALAALAGTAVLVRGGQRPAPSAEGAPVTTADTPSPAAAPSFPPPPAPLAPAPTASSTVPGHAGSLVTRDPLSGSPVTRDPLSGSPVTRDPLSGSPVTRDPLSGSPVTRDPLSGSPVTRDPLSGSPVGIPGVTPRPPSARPSAPAVAKPLLFDPTRSR